MVNIYLTHYIFGVFTRGLQNVGYIGFIGYKRPFCTPLVHIWPLARRHRSEAQNPQKRSNRSNFGALAKDWPEWYNPKYSDLPICSDIMHSRFEQLMQQKAPASSHLRGLSAWGSSRRQGRCLPTPVCPLRPRGSGCHRVPSNQINAGIPVPVLPSAGLHCPSPHLLSTPIVALPWRSPYGHNASSLKPAQPAFRGFRLSTLRAARRVVAGGLRLALRHKVSYRLAVVLAQQFVPFAPSAP